jgi:hypothetical protein
LEGTCSGFIIHLNIEAEEGEGQNGEAGIERSALPKDMERIITECIDRGSKYLGIHDVFTVTRNHPSTDKKTSSFLRQNMQRIHFIHCQHHPSVGGLWIYG